MKLTWKTNSSGAEMTQPASFRVLLPGSCDNALGIIRGTCLVGMTQDSRDANCASGATASKLGCGGVVMDLIDIFPHGTQVCFVSPFRLSIPFISENDSENVSQCIYEKWGIDISSKLTEKINSSGTDYMFSWNKISGDCPDDEFTPNCFLMGEAVDCYEKNKCFRELGRYISFSGIVFTIRSIEIKIWNFGFGSIKIVSTINLDKNSVHRNSLNGFIDELQKVISNTRFSEALENIINNEIIARCDYNDDLKSNRSFAERVTQHENQDDLWSHYELSKPQILFMVEVQDRDDFIGKNNIFSIYLHSLQINDKMEENLSELYVSDDKKLVISIWGQCSETFYNLEEVIIVHRDFADYLNKIGETYESFFVPYHDMISKQNIFYRITGPSRRALSWNFLKENNCLDKILAEFREVSRMDVTKFNIFEKAANSRLTYSDFCIFESSIEYFGLNKMNNCNKILYSHINSYFTKINDHIEKMSSIFGKTIIIGFNFILASIAYIIGVASLDYVRNSEIDEFEIIATNLLAQWIFPGLVFFGFVLLVLSIFFARCDEKKHINRIKRKELKKHQMWIFMLKTKKKRKERTSD